MNYLFQKYVFYNYQQLNFEEAFGGIKKATVPVMVVIQDKREPFLEG
jgi:hypothetical protein